jgi:hypothetical protein
MPSRTRTRNCVDVTMGDLGEDFSEACWSFRAATTTGRTNAKLGSLVP